VIAQSQQTLLTPLVAVSGIQRWSQRVRIELCDDSVGPAGALDLALALNAGSDAAVISAGDIWAPDAVARLCGALSPQGVAYADEDRLSEKGDHVAPRLKPAYSPEFLLHSPYIGRPMAVGAELLERITSLGELHPEQFEHDLALRACEMAVQVIHVPEVLCHRLGDDQRSAPASRPTHVSAAIARRGEDAEVVVDATRTTIRVVRHVAHEVPVSIIVPFRDEPQFLRTCIESIDATRGQKPVEFVLVDNGSEQPETATLVERLSGRSDVRILRDDRSFNWAALNNAAAADASGEVLVFLNNDIEAHKDGWLDALCAQAMRPEVGAVGARLVYPDGRLQHCGTVIGLGGAAGHLFVGLAGDQPGYLNMAVTTRECAAVTGACLAIRRDVFQLLHGFDETLGVDLNDVDYCLRALRAGLRVLYEPEAELVHHESPSRGTGGDPRDIRHFIDRWQGSILAGDPYLHPALTRVDSSCALRGPDEEEWWHTWHATLSNS
jgi:GT2 family glycosyltransferase